MLAILTDRYSGTYSGGKWLVIDTYYQTLTQDEVDYLNNHLSETDEFYGLRKLGYEPTVVTLNSTRLEAVEKTMQNSDCYAHWDHGIMPWMRATNDIDSCASGAFKDVIEAVIEVWQHDNNPWEMKEV